MAFKTKAESMFEEKVQYAIEKRDWDMLCKVGSQYEAYLDLIAPISEPTEEIEFVGHNEPSMIEEFQYTMSKEHARFCIETLHVNPETMEKLQCGICGMPIQGFSSITFNGVEKFFCHEGQSPTCYERASNLTPHDDVIHLI